MINIKELPRMKQECIDACFKLLDEDTKDHNWNCQCKRCKVWKQALALGMVQERDNDDE